MLTRTLTCLLFILTLNQLSAQFSIGVQGGLNTSTIHISGHPDEGFHNSQYRNHYFAGITSNYQLCNKWSVGLDAQYAVRGVGYDVEGNANAVANSRRNNIDLTPKISYQLLKNLDLSFGVYHSSFHRLEVQFGNSSDWVEPFAIYYAKTDFGLSPGLRLHFGRFSLVASSQIGLKSIASFEYTDANGQRAGELKEKNRAFQLGVGYRVW